MRRLNRIWTDIRRGQHIDLYVLVVVATILAALSILGVVSDKLVPPVTLAALAVLCAATLGTRHYVEEQLQKLAAPALTLGDRSQLPSIQERGRTASEIVVVGVSLISIVPPYLDFYEQKMRDGCTLRFLLLDPKSPSLKTLDSMIRVTNTQHDIEQSLTSLRALIEAQKNVKGKCEVRQSSVFLPFGIAAFDPDKETGFMNVELLAYKKFFGERPHFVLTRRNNSKWFEFFKSQYEQLWSESQVWPSK